MKGENNGKNEKNNHDDSGCIPCNGALHRLLFTAEHGIRPGHKGQMRKDGRQLYQEDR